MSFQYTCRAGHKFIASSEIPFEFDLGDFKKEHKSCESYKAECIFCIIKDNKIKGLEENLETIKADKEHVEYWKDQYSSIIYTVNDFRDKIRDLETGIETRDKAIQDQKIEINQLWEDSDCSQKDIVRLGKEVDGLSKYSARQSIEIQEWITVRKGKDLKISSLEAQIALLKLRPAIKCHRCYKKAKKIHSLQQTIRDMHDMHCSPCQDKTDEIERKNLVIGLQDEKMKSLSNVIELQGEVSQENDRLRGKMDRMENSSLVDQGTIEDLDRRINSLTMKCHELEDTIDLQKRSWGWEAVNKLNEELCEMKAEKFYTVSCQDCLTKLSEIAKKEATIITMSKEIDSKDKQVESQAGIIRTQRDELDRKKESMSDYQRDALLHKDKVINDLKYQVRHLNQMLSGKSSPLP